MAFHWGLWSNFVLFWGHIWFKGSDVWIRYLSLLGHDLLCTALGATTLAPRICRVYIRDYGSRLALVKRIVAEGGCARHGAPTAISDLRSIDVWIVVLKAVIFVYRWFWVAARLNFLKAQLVYILLKVDKLFCDKDFLARELLLWLLNHVVFVIHELFWPCRFEIYFFDVLASLII